MPGVKAAAWWQAASVGMQADIGCQPKHGRPPDLAGRPTQIYLGSVSEAPAREGSGLQAITLPPCALLDFTRKHPETPFVSGCRPTGAVHHVSDAAPLPAMASGEGATPNAATALETG